MILIKSVAVIFERGSVKSKIFILILKMVVIIGKKCLTKAKKSPRSLKVGKKLGSISKSGTNL